MIEFSTLPEFDKDLKKLKRFRTLENDLKVLKKYLRKYPQGFPPVVVPISGIKVNEKLFKVKHFRCKALKQKGSRSGIRVVYAYFKEECKIEFIEIYYKEKDDTDCDKERVYDNYEKREDSQNSEK